MRLLAPRVLLATTATVAGIGISVSAMPPAAQAAAPCWQRVIADWADNSSIDGTYSADCYRAAIANAPTDLQIYSNLEDDLQRALQARTARRIAVDPARTTVAHRARLVADSSSTSPVVVALGAGLGLIAAAVSTALVIGRRRR